MALRDIIILPDKRLRSVSKPVVAIGDEIPQLVADMRRRVPSHVRIEPDALM
jgi:peptide deformylase